MMGPRPLKELGQHFLMDEEAAAKIVAGMQLRWEDRALEIGPGRGVLLRFLLKQSHKTTAVEVDSRLYHSLWKTFGGHPGLDLHCDDFLNFNLKSYIQSDSSVVKIVGNIPYSLSSTILFKLFDAAAELQGEGSTNLHSATIMLQKEVAERVCAHSGSRIYGGISVFRTLVAEAELLFSLPPEVFHPEPKVKSAVIRLKFYQTPRYPMVDRLRFNALVHHLFTQRRKMLKNSLASLPGIRWNDPVLDFDLTRRPEELPCEEFIRLHEMIVQTFPDYFSSPEIPETS